ncbi:MAG: glycoside hydrolase family 2 protein [Anaerolineales bacterium]|nr:glycoside hydrolase family 2 protein [Anaerolineales bacterium]
MKIQSLAGAWEFRQVGTEEWLPANVPGCVHTDLLALGQIPDPFVGDNERRIQWVAEADWEYRYQFDTEAEFLRQPQIWLICDGLDTLATVSLNGHELERTANMFRQYRWDVKTLLKAEENELHIAFDSPVRFATAQQAIRSMPGVSHAIPGGPYLRKAPCQFGWDWGPQLPPIGIWKDIRLEGYQGARIAEVHLRQQHSGSQVTVEARVAIHIWDEAPYSIVMRILAPDGQVFETSAEVSPGNENTLRVDIPDPQLWWPNGYGAQPIHQVTVELHEADTVLEQREYQLGLRTLELRQQPDEWGHSFTFVVNGLPIFAKGANWIPADSFPTRISEAQLEWLFRAATEAHQNMLRVWGGGFYEEDRFYDLCDRYGILVWQDFIFSCSVYPFNDPDYVENVRVEVVENIRRLRHRASLALWCGNNEMEWGWAEWGWKVPEYQDLQEAYDEFFHHTLPAWCAAEDPDRAYWPSSPSSGTPFEDPNGQQQGNTHYWDVWHMRKPFTEYRDQYPRFMSEFGFQALPPMATIRTYADESDWNMTSYVMEQHQKHESGNALIVAQMLDTFRMPKDFEALVYLSLVLQAEGIRYGVEHWRRHPRRVSGTLYWQLNDCWPVASWSSLDYFGRWKALHYAARRFYAPLLLSIEDKPTEQDVYITSDLRETWEGSVHWSLEMLDGVVVEAGEEAVKAAPLDVTPVCNLEFSDHLNDDLRREVVFIAELCQDGKVLSRQTAFFVPTKHLSLAKPAISTQLRVEQEHIHIELTSQSLARLVECTLEGADVVFSDNYFDLPAGRTVSISAPLPNGWTPEQAKSALKIRSVYDSYALGAAT